jgi:MerR family mercuric resistance operon transcriptional regulator
MLGFSLEQIKELLALRVQSIDTCERVRERTLVKISNIEHKIGALQEMRRALDGLVSACSRRRKTDECPILDSLEADGDDL